MTGCVKVLKHALCPGGHNHIFLLWTAIPSLLTKPCKRSGKGLGLWWWGRGGRDQEVGGGIKRELVALQDVGTQELPGNPKKSQLMHRSLLKMPGHLWRKGKLLSHIMEKVAYDTVRISNGQHMEWMNLMKSIPSCLRRRLGYRPFYVMYLGKCTAATWEEKCEMMLDIAAKV